MSVSAKNANEAEEKAQAYLEENSPLRDWEVYSEAEEIDMDVVDIEI